MPRLLSLVMVVLTASTLCLAETGTDKPQNPPTPSLYAISWEFAFTWRTASRIVVEVPGKTTPQAYWYLPYTVTNNTGAERMFMPDFELVAPDGKVHRSDTNISPTVIAAIRVREGNKFIVSSTEASGELRLGPEQAKYGVAVWPEPAFRMERFAILVAGLSGESTRVKSAAGEETLLRKTLQLNFHINGDEFYPGEDKVNEKPYEWIMR